MTAPDSIPNPPLAASERIDEICMRYEDHWLEGARPDLAAFINDVDEADRPALVYELLRIDLAFGGPKRELLSESAYLKRLPEFHDVIHIAFRRQPSTSTLVPYRPGQRVGRFTVLKEVGQGGFGAVYAARDESLERVVALKTLRLEIAADPIQRERLLDEAKLAAVLDHENIASIYEVESQPDQPPLLVYQYIEGQSLRDRLKRESLNFNTTAAILRTLANAAHYAHKHGVVHCDLQPSNVLLTSDGRPVITDFGLGTHDGIRPALDGEVAGSPPYLAPEQTRGDARQLDARTDVWALGVVLYECLVGGRPFSGESTDEIMKKIQQHSPPAPTELNPAIPLALSKICMRCLQKAPADRYNSALELQLALDRYLNHGVMLRRIVVAAALGCLLAAPAMAMMLAPSKAKQPDKVRWRASSELLVERGDFWSQAGSSQAPAVGDGDHVRFQVELSRPAHLYVVWIDGSGHAAPVYPWRNGKWSDVGPDTKRDRLALPADVAKFWRMRVDREATETVLVVARDEPLQAPNRAAKWFEDLPSQPPIAGEPIVRFHNGQVELKGSGDRSPDLKNPGSSKHGVLLAQRLLMERLEPHFPLIHSYCFAVYP